MKMLFERKETNIQDNILFLGNRDDVYRLYRAMDVFVLPSRYEGLPMVGVEAQASGLPCIFSDRITREVKATENVVFLGIKSILPWVNMILNKKKRTSRQDSLENFDIFSQTNRLENFYNNAITQLEKENIL